MTVTTEGDPAGHRPRSTSRSSRAASASCRGPSAREGRRRHQPEPERGRDARPGRRERLRQVDRRPDDPAPAPADRGHDRRSTVRTSRSCRRKALIPFRRKAQIIFQDPYNALNPRHTVGTIISAPFTIQGVKPQGGVKNAVYELMERVGLNPEHYNRYPNEFSGGQRQRIGIARADRPAAEVHRLRRAGVRARRVDPGADPEPAARPPGRVRRRLPVRGPRPRGRPADLAPRRGHVPRQHHGERAAEGDLLRAAPPVHALAAVRGADPGPEAPAQAATGSCSQGDLPSPIDPPIGLRLPDALLPGPGEVRRSRCRRSSSCRPATTSRATSRSQVADLPKRIEVARPRRTWHETTTRRRQSQQRRGPASVTAAARRPSRASSASARRRGARQSVGSTNSQPGCHVMPCRARASRGRRRGAGARAPTGSRSGR